MTTQCILGVNTCAVIMPAFNESEVVGDVVRDIRNELDIPIWVINDHSSDGTANAAASAGARVISLPEQLGAWGAVQTGLREALRLGITCAVTMDSDGQHDPSYLPELIKPVLDNKADVVIGACPARGSRLRKLAWSLMRLTSGLKTEDLTSGYRALNSRAIELLSEPGASQLEFQDIGVLLMLEKAGLRVMEHSVVMPKRANGKSRIFRSWGAVASYMLQTLFLGAVKRRLRRSP